MTDRQRLLLAAIIQEFVETAEAVGSVSIVDRYNFDISPATVRNEMSELVKQGYLAKAHSSAGRSPTTLGWRYYIQELLELERLEAEREIAIRENLFQRRFNKVSLMQNAVKSLSELTGLPAIALIGNTIFFAGFSDLLENPEFNSIADVRKIVVLFESPELLNRLFSSYRGTEEICVLIGDEMKLQDFDNCSIVFSSFRSYKNEPGKLSVIGPKRMNYARVLPSVETVAHMLSNVISGW